MVRVEINIEINVSKEKVFNWFYDSENFIASPIVFKSSCVGDKKCDIGSVRDIVMIAGYITRKLQK